MLGGNCNDYDVGNDLTKTQCLLDGLLRNEHSLQDNKPYQLRLAKTWHHLGGLQRDFRHWEESENALISSLTLYKKLGVRYVEQQAMVCFDLALLKSERQQWEGAEDYFRFSQDMFQNLGANDVNSLLADELADTWLHWGILKRRQKQWHVAEILFKKSEELYLRLGAGQGSSPYADELAETWVNIAIVWHAQQKTDKAQSLLQQAESLYLKLGANNSNSPHAEELADTWLQLGLLLQNCREHGSAEKKMQQAYDLYSELHAGQDNSPFSDELAETQVHLTRLFNEVEDWPKLRETLQSVLRLYANMTHFPGDFIEELIYLSSIATRSSVAANALFQQLSSLLAKWQSLQVGDAGLFKRTQGFWCYWICFALEQKNHSLLLDIFGASQGQRLLEIVQSNLQAHSKKGDTDVLNFLQAQQKLRKLELEILSVNQPLPSQTSLYLRQKKKRLKASYRIVRNEWLKLRQGLAEQGNNLFTPLPILRTKELQACLAPHEAIVFVVSLSSYGIDEDPRLLLVQSDRIDCVVITALNQAESAMCRLNNALTSQGRSLSLRYPSVSQFFNDDFNIISLDDCLIELQTAMQQYRNVLKNLLGPHVSSVHIISQEPFHGLPWQYACPVSISAFYPGLHTFWQRRHSNQNIKPIMPNRESPLCLLNHGCDDDPMKRLYYLPAEIELISHVWGEGVVENPDSLPINDGKPRLLFLLGHGSFNNGDAQFGLKQSKLNAHDIISYPNPLYALGTSACLLASHKDIANEPFGLFSLTASRSDIRFGMGAIVPVDDLWSTCLSLLFHYYWRQLGSPNEAIRSALEALESGHWPEEAKTLFKMVFAIQLPLIFNELQQNIADAPIALYEQLQLRCENVLQPWTRHTAYYIRQYNIIIDGYSDEKAKLQATEILVDGFLENLPMNQQALASFMPFWLWG